MVNGSFNQANLQYKQVHIARRLPEVVGQIGVQIHL